MHDDRSPDPPAPAGTPQAARCPACGAAFGCGARLTPEQGGCWCAALPPLTALPTSPEDGTGPSSPAACLCPACLGAALDRQRNERRTR
jgi:hypothetical protein